MYILEKQQVGKVLSAFPFSQTWFVFLVFFNGSTIISKDNRNYVPICFGTVECSTSAFVIIIGEFTLLKSLRARKPFLFFQNITSELPQIKRQAKFHNSVCISSGWRFCLVYRWILNHHGASLFWVSFAYFEFFFSHLS